MSSLFLPLIQLAFPFLWWKNQEHDNFLEYIGIKPPIMKGQIWIVILMAAILLFISNVNVMEYFDDFSMQQIDDFMEKVAKADDREIERPKMSLAAIILSTVILAIRTSTSYIFNYGFILKRLVDRFGGNIGILIDSIIFAGFGNLILIPTGISGSSHALFFMVGFITCVINGTLSENFFEGSIIPGLGISLLGDIVFSLISLV